VTTILTIVGLVGVLASAVYLILLKSGVVEQDDLFARGFEYLKGLFKS
jgi:hypothetical protein